MSVVRRAIVLGCGSSPGVPRLGPDWGDCDPSEPKNRRSRCALLIEQTADGNRPTRILIDTGPDMRSQLLAAAVDRLDAVLYTHPHADHIHGIDDLRGFWLGDKRRVPVYADAPTMARLVQAFGYCFRSPPGSSYPPIVEPHPLVVGQPTTIDGPSGPIVVEPFRQIHGDIDSLGFRIGGLAYSCDISGIPDETLPVLSGLGVWIVDALRYKPHPSHFSVSETLAWVERLKPERTVLTHMHSDLDYARLKAALPVGVVPAYDGMEIAF